MGQGIFSTHLRNMATVPSAERTLTASLLKITMSYDTEGKNPCSNLQLPSYRHLSQSCCQLCTSLFLLFGLIRLGSDRQSNSTALFPSFPINKAELNVIPVIFILVCVGLWPPSSPRDCSVTPFFTLKCLVELMKDQIKSSSSPVHSSASPSMCSTSSL